MFIIAEIVDGTTISWPAAFTIVTMVAAVAFMIWVLFKSTR